MTDLSRARHHQHAMFPNCEQRTTLWWEKCEKKSDRDPSPQNKMVEIWAGSLSRSLNVGLIAQIEGSPEWNPALIPVSRSKNLTRLDYKLHSRRIIIYPTSQSARVCIITVIRSDETVFRIRWRYRSMIDHRPFWRRVFIILEQRLQLNEFSSYINRNK